MRGREIGFVFQSFHLVPQLDVMRNVMLAARYAPTENGESLHERASELIDRVGLVTSPAGTGPSSCPTARCNGSRSRAPCSPPPA